MDFAKAAERLAQLGDTVKQLRERVERAIKTKAAAGKPVVASSPGKTADEARPEAAATLAVSPAEALRAADTIRGLLSTLDGWAKQSSGFSPSSTGGRRNLTMTRENRSKTTPSSCAKRRPGKRASRTTCS